MSTPPTASTIARAMNLPASANGESCGATPTNHDSCGERRATATARTADTQPATGCTDQPPGMLDRAERHRYDHDQRGGPDTRRGNTGPWTRRDSSYDQEHSGKWSKPSVNRPCRAVSEKACGPRPESRTHGSNRLRPRTPHR
jgi:hypothetical protein